MADGVDIGVISSHLFKPYEWVFAGPFAAASDPMDREYPPQSGVRVLDVYDDSNGAIGWVAAGDAIYTDRGEISLRGLLAQPGVGFLHTVVQTGYDTTLPVFMSATAPVELLNY